MSDDPSTRGLPHSREPWRKATASEAPDCLIIVMDDGTSVADFASGSPDFPPGMATGNAERAVTCVNFCAGVPNAKLPRFGLAGMLQAMNYAAANFASVELQRAVLLDLAQAALDALLAAEIVAGPDPDLRYYRLDGNAMAATMNRIRDGLAAVKS